MPTGVRAYLAVVFWYHGWGKLADPVEWTSRRMEGGVPLWLVSIAVFAESVGAVLMALGALARLAAALLIGQMIGAIWLVHWKNGMFGRGGYEFNLALIVLSLVVLVLGAGAWSVDRAIASSTGSREAPARD